MPRVRAYRKKDGTLVRAHSRGSVSIGSFRGRVSGQASLSHLRHTGRARTPGFLRQALKDWSSRNIYMGNNGQLRYYRHASPSGKRGEVTPYSGKIKRLYKLGTRETRSMQFHHRAQRQK